MRRNDMPKKFSIVIPVYKNEQNLPITIPYIMERLDLFPDYEVELIMVCDGSPDNSYAIMERYQRQYPEKLKIACFTRNFGQGAAVHCGLDMAAGDVIGVIACDLQDPFELFADMLAEWEKGYKLVIASRKERGDKGLSALGSKCFNRLVHRWVNPRFPAGGFDFFLVDREVAEAFCRIDVPNASMQMHLLWLGYEYKEIPYVRQARKVGSSSWNFGKKINAALGLFVSSSVVMLRALGVLGVLLTMAGGIGSLVGVIFLLRGASFPALTALLSVGGLFTGVLLIALWVFGEYMWRTFDLVKERPRYVIAKLSENAKERIV